MNIILTDDLRYCPETIPQGYIIEKVTPQTLFKFNDNSNVEMVLCTRGLARELKRINLPMCKLVQLFSVGYDNVDLEWFKSMHIPLCNASGVYNNVLAEYVVYSLLLYAKRFHKSLKNRMFRPFRNYHYMTELAGKTIGIMGCGSIGSSVAKHLSGFNVRILGYAKRTVTKEGFSQIYHKNNINSFFNECDFVINTLPHDESTVGLIDKEVLENTKSNFVFVNIGRDSILNQNDFFSYMKSHKNAVAILDMFELIPNPLTNKYHRLNNVLVMPRISAISQESDTALKNLVLHNINAVFYHTELKNRVI